MAANGFKLPDQFSDDLVDEDGEKMSKRFAMFRLKIDQS